MTFLLRHNEGIASDLSAAADSLPPSDLGRTGPRPSPAQIAFALIVLKSKPVELSLEDYFTQLRQRIQTGPRPILPEEHEHLDSIVFWKQAYKDSEAAQAKLLDRIYELEQDQTMPMNGLAFLEMPTSPIATNKRKRKNETMAKANSQSKRRVVLAKTPQSPEIVTGDSPSAEKANEPDEIQSCSVGFMRHFFNLRQQIVSKRPDVRALHHALRDLCRVAGTLISNRTPAAFPSEPSKKASAQASTTNLQSTSLAIQRSYPSILLGLDKLFTESNGTGEVGSVVYEAIVLFESTIAKISTLAVQKAEEIGESNPKAKTARAKSRAPKQTQSPPSHDHQATCQSLAHLAVTMLTTVDPSKEPQSQILEGCLCAFLDHLGSSLSLAVFSDDQSIEQREIFTGLLSPQGLQDMSNLDSGTATRAVQLEAPYLIYILDKVMAFVDGHQALMSSRSTSLFSLSKDSSDTFAKQIREKLQNTLLKGVFGDDDETFRNSLQKPIGLESGMDGDLPAQLGPAEQTPEWFTGEIWRILGWNILAGDDASF